MKRTTSPVVAALSQWCDVAGIVGAQKPGMHVPLLSFVGNDAGHSLYV